jgi:hypothetical protein
MMRLRMTYGVCLAVALLGGSTVHAQSALGGAIGAPTAIVLRDSPSLGVQDNASFFQLDSVLKAREAIQQFRREYHRDLFIETFEHVPSADQTRVSKMWSRQAERYFSEWATTRAKTIGVDGVYILICRKPQHVHVLVYPSTPEQAFSDEDARALRKRLEHDLPKSPDSALSGAVTFVRNTVKDNLAARESAASSITLQTVIAIIAGVVGFWLLLSLVRAVLNRAGAGSDLGHGSLASGFFGALFGTTAGHWVYDHLFRAHPPAAPQPESDYLHGPQSAPATDAELSAEAHDHEEPTTWSHG